MEHKDNIATVGGEVAPLMTFQCMLPPVDSHILSHLLNFGDKQWEVCLSLSVAFNRIFEALNTYSG